MVAFSLSTIQQPADVSRRRFLHASVCFLSLPLASTMICPAVAATPSPQVQRLSLPAGQGGDDIEFIVLGDVGAGESRVVFASLRSTVGLLSLSLIDPQQRLVWRKTPAQLGFTPREISQHPELGDAIAVPELRLPQAGFWRLRLARALPLVGAGQVLFSARQLPRFELGLTAMNTTLDVGQVQNYVLRPTDFGAPVLGLGDLPLDLRDASGARITVPEAHEGLRTPAGILISDEPGAYFSRFGLPAAGDYRLRASHLFTGNKLAQAELSLRAIAGADVAQALPLRLKRITFETQEACVKAVIFELDLEIASPGLYAATLLLVSGAQSRQFSRSSQLQAGKSSLQIRVPVGSLHELGAPLTSIARLGLIRFGPDKAGPVAEVLNLDLGAEQRIKFKSLCTG